MATTTRMRVSSSSQVFHRVGAVGDLPQTDVRTSDTVAQGVGGSADFQIEGDETVVHVSVSKVVTTAAAIGGDVDIASYIYIKNTGYTTSAKTAATTSTVNVGLGAAYATAVQGFKLEAGEAITLHGLTAASDNLNAIFLTSSSGDVYTEIVYL